jgi:hypothetical protein
LKEKINVKKILPIAFTSIALYFLASSSLMAQENSSGKLLKHVVLFGWPDGTSQTDIDKIVKAFEDLPSKISQIKGFEWGINNSPEGLNQGLTHCFILSFKSEKDRDAYLIHPVHQAFVKALVPAPIKVTVVDFWSKNNQP